MFPGARRSYISFAVRANAFPRCGGGGKSRVLSTAPVSREVRSVNHTRSLAAAYSSGSSLRNSSSCCGRGGYGVDLKSMGIGSNVASAFQGLHDNMSSCGQSQHHHDNLHHHHQSGHSCSHHGGHRGCESRGNGYGDHGSGGEKCTRSEGRVAGSSGSCSSGGSGATMNGTSHDHSAIRIDHSAVSTNTAPPAPTASAASGASGGGCPFHAAMDSGAHGDRAGMDIASALAALGRPPSSLPSSKFAHIEDKFVRAMIEGAAETMKTQKGDGECQRHKADQAKEAIDPSVVAAARAGKCPYFAAAAQHQHK